MLEHEARTFRMPDLNLIDKESLGQQNPSRFKRAGEFRKQRAVQKIHIDDDVETLIAKRKPIEVRRQRPYRWLNEPRQLAESLQRDLRKIRRDHAQSATRERDRIAAASSRDIEDQAAARKQRQHFRHEGLRIAGRRFRAMRGVPLPALLGGHHTRASVSTSTRAAPAAISTRAHLSTVAPVVMTSSTSGARGGP